VSKLHLVFGVLVLLIVGCYKDKHDNGIAGQTSADGVAGRVSSDQVAGGRISSDESSGRLVFSANGADGTSGCGERKYCRV
jgi:hypothetical protein